MNVKKPERSDDKLYKTLVYLSNAVYYLHYGRQSPSIMAKARMNIKLFAAEYRRYFGKGACIPKYHWFQHFADFVAIHGSAFLFDSFVLERFLGFLKRRVTSSVNQIKNVISTFLLKYHSPLLNHTDRFDKLNSKSSMRETIRDMGFDLSYFTTLGCYSKKMLEGNLAAVPIDHDRLIRDYLKVEKAGLGLENAKLVRHSRIKFRNVLLTSEMFHHKKNIRDCYCVCNEDYPGKIVDICSVVADDQELYLIVVKKHEKKTFTTRGGLLLLSPDNQFPVEETNELQVFCLEDALFLQKVLLVEGFCWAGKVLNVFCVRPNEFFDF